MNMLKHIAVVAVSLFLFLGIPTCMYVDIPSLFVKDIDGVTHASIALPEQPSGEFLILLNRSKHGDTCEQWHTFFSGEDAGVIMSDIDCMVIDTDATGIQLAERFQARLPENQMRIRRENGLLLASKADYALFDAVVLSREMAEAYQMQTDRYGGNIDCIYMKGE